MAETLSEQVAALENALVEAERQLLAQRRRAETAERNEAMLRLRVKAAESREKQARVEGARSALTDIHKAIAFDPITVNQIRAFRDREYPATGEEPTRCADVVGCDGKCCARPAPPAVTGPPRWELAVFVERVGDIQRQYIHITPEDACAIVALASRPTASGEG